MTRREVGHPLARTVPPDTNPHTFGALATSVARLEGSLVAPLACENPPGENSRPGCLKVVVGPAARHRRPRSSRWADDRSHRRSRRRVEAQQAPTLVSSRLRHRQPSTATVHP